MQIAKRLDQCKHAGRVLNLETALQRGLLEVGQDRVLSVKLPTSCAQDIEMIVRVKESQPTTTFFRRQDK